MHSTSIMTADGLHLLLNFPDLGCAAADAPTNILKANMKIKKVNNFLILKQLSVLKRNFKWKMTITIWLGSNRKKLRLTCFHTLNEVAIKNEFSEANILSYFVVSFFTRHFDKSFGICPSPNAEFLRTFCLRRKQN